MTQPVRTVSHSCDDDVPLCVDLDGTLVRTDLLVESYLRLVSTNPVLGLRALLWLRHGRAYFKHRIAQLVTLDVQRLPYHPEFLEYLHRQRERGRTLVLATASNRSLAEEVARQLQLFDLVIASDSTVNMAGTVKAETLRAQFGKTGFDYAANARADLRVWTHARRAVLVNPLPGVSRTVGKFATVERVFRDKDGRMSKYLEAMRPHQWLKNILVFVPLVAAHQVADPALVANAVLAFLAFGLCASSTYVLNDLMDVAADRAHPRKRHRPFASGKIPVRHGPLIALPLLLGGAGIAWLLPSGFAAALGLYVLTTLLYSFWLKSVVLLDVVVLAGLYTIRIIAGGAAVAIAPSFWLLAFSMFLFLSLAIVKRYSELSELAKVQEHENRVRRRGYRRRDLDTLGTLGGSSGYLAVLVLALYLNSEDVSITYTHPRVLWLLCPLLLYWIGRVWVLAGRQSMRDDPLLFALGDRVSWLVAILVLSIVWIAA